MTARDDAAMTEDQIIECNCLAVELRHEASNDSIWTAYKKGLAAGIAQAAITAYREEHEAEVERLKEALELERLRVAGLGVVAMANTPESAKQQRITRDSPVWCASFGDVERAVDAEMILRSENTALQSRVKDLEEQLEQGREHVKFMNEQLEALTKQ